MLRSPLRLGSVVRRVVRGIHWVMSLRCEVAERGNENGPTRADDDDDYHSSPTVRYGISPNLDYYLLVTQSRHMQTHAYALPQPTGKRRRGRGRR